ncbi:hypothetical protein H4R99_005850 [Coemansia sp. RSA 1722]|nr:hypothetical protein IWW45_001626 [Coemansia sp. RSA 485]KAJ2594295.1 hypothetical protein H4R99_005850 [Coemansia sp. RSA 1722]
MNRPLIYYIALLIVVNIWLSWDSDDTPHHSPDERAAYERQWWASFRSLEFPANSTYLQLPAKVRTAVDRLMGPSLQPRTEGEATTGTDGDISSVFHGSWVAEHHDDDTETSQPEQRSRPANGALGRLAMQLEGVESTVSGTQLVYGNVQLLARGFTERLSMRGMYWSETDTAVLYGVRQMHAQAPVGAVRAMPSNQTFTQAKTAYAQRLAGRLAEYPMPTDAVQACEYQLFVRFSSAELALPLNAARRPSGLLAQTIMYSDGCSVSVATPRGQPLAGISASAYQQRASHYLRLVFAAMLAEVLLLVGQMRHAPTHAGMSKISPYTLAMQIVLACCIFVAHVSGGMAPTGDAQLAFTGASFVVFTLAMMFAVYYMMSVWHVQHPAHAEAAADSYRGMLSTYVPFYASIAAGALIVHLYTETMHVLAGLLMALLLAASYSYWVPQIWRNARRGTTRGLRKDYILGTTALYLLFPLYAFACPQSLTFNRPSPFVWALVVYSLAQVAVLALQDLLGPRFFVPVSMLPEVYNYHPLLPPDDDESRVGAEASDDEGSDSEGEGSTNSDLDQDHDLEQSADGADQDGADQDEPARRRGNRECAICIQHVDVSPTAASSLFGRAPYMVTPCHHVYHTECLTRWMEMKLECPVCRAPLPPI